MFVDCIIPLFNKKNYISKAIESAINQKIKKFNNIIIVNDGSTDGSDVIVEKLSKKHPSLRIINQINLGSSEARNVGIKNSNADYLVFLDADDQLHSKYLFCLHLMKFHNPDCKVFSTKHLNIYNNKEIIENSNNLKIFKSKIIKLNNPILNYSINPKLFCSSGICIERNLILNNLFPKNINVGEDIYTWLKIFQYNKLVLYNKELIYIFKISENRSIDIFQEIPYFFSKIYEFKKLKKISYNFYFLISSLIYSFQTRPNVRLNKEFLILIKSQSLSIFFFLKIFNNYLTDKTYNYYKKLKYKKESKRKSNNIKNIYFLGSSYFLLLPGMPFIIIIFYISNKFESLADVMLMSSISIFLTSSITLFVRPYALIRDNIRVSLKFIKIKNIFFFPLFIFLTFLIFIFNLENYNVMTIGILFILYIWKKESIVQIYEITESDNFILKNFFEVLIIKAFLILSIIYGNSFTDLIIFYLFLFINIFQSYRYVFKLNFKRVVNILKPLALNEILIISINAMIVNLTNFMHRYLILFYVNKTLAGLLFFIYSLGSFPANLFNFVFATTIIRNNLKIPVVLKIISLVYLLTISYIFLIFYLKPEKSLLYLIFQKEHLLYILFSMVGGIFMTMGLYNKNKIFKFKLKKLIFFEIFYSFVILVTIPVIYHMFDKNLFYYIFFINGLLFYLTFSYLYSLEKRNE